MTGMMKTNNIKVSTLEGEFNLTSLSSVIDECKSILSMIEGEQLTIDKLIEKLAQLVIDAEKLRRDILISKTTGTSAAVVGSLLTVVGFCLTPFTFGISTVVLPAVGASLAGAGTLTNIGAAITDGCLTSKQATQLTELLEEFKKLQYGCHSKEIKLLKESKHFSEPEKSKHQRLDVIKWLKCGLLHQDETVYQHELM